MSSLGQMPFFIEFLKTSGLFDKWVEDCPLTYTSRNAPLEARRVGNNFAVGAVGTLAVRAHQCVARRRCEPRITGHEQRWPAKTRCGAR